MMAKRTTAQIRTKTQLVQKVIKHYFGTEPKKIEFKPAGLTNFVFEVQCKDEIFIVRIGSSAGKLSDYLKEQWAVEKAGRIGVPVAEILEVGSEIIHAPYMLQKKVEGTEAVNHPLRHEILKELGAYTQLIHSIPTNNFGNTFNWSKNRLSKNSTWKEYLHGEWDLPGRMKTLKQTGFFTKTKWTRLEKAVRQMEKWTFSPALNHGDLRLKNVMVNEKGKILALLDWEHCVSHIAPLWDLSIALHDLSIDNKQYFLEGYGIKPLEYESLSQGINIFNILNNACLLQPLNEKKDKTGLEVFRMRLNGSLDLFSL
ncbi:MAG TPA: aminoglycoside phosphotransferase family protein, partial [Flavisolibacter sp.]|nr:aminoglycoside phosphotransferase family protein [Flavisolibacter sp.]